MQTVSAAFQAAVTQPHTRVARVTLLDVDLTPIQTIDDVIDGSVTTDTERRRSCSLTVANADGDWTPAIASDALFPNRLLRVERGIQLVQGTAEYVTLGTFVIDRPSISLSAATVTVVGQDRLKLAVNSSFTRPTYYDQGTPVGEVIRMIAQAAGMGATLYRLNDAGRALGSDVVAEVGDNRVEAIRKLAADHALEVYVAADGYLVVEPAATEPPAAVWTFAPGQDGILLDITKDFTDDQLYNHVLVQAESSTGILIQAEARDLNASSPAYNPEDGSGPIGDRLYTYRSALIRDAQQAQDVANALLLRVALVQETIAFPSVVHPAIEVGDVVAIIEPNTRTSDEYLIDSMTIPLRSGSMAGTSQKVRALTAEAPVVVVPPPVVVPTPVTHQASGVGPAWATVAATGTILGAPPAATPGFGLPNVLPFTLPPGGTTSTGTGGGTTPPPPSSTIPFGVVDHLQWHSLADAKTSIDRQAAGGMKWMRFDLGWRWAETADGVYGGAYLSQFFQTLDYAASKGMRTIVTVIEAPGWANGNTGLWELDGATTRQKYAEFMGYIAGQTATRANMTWEIWNEENDPNFWTGGANVANYTDLLTRSYSAIKAADPDATVINGGILYGDTAFLEGIYTNGGGNSFDGLAIHPYAKTYAPTDTSDRYFSFKAQIEDFRTKLNDHGQSSKKLYLTEWGWGVGPTQFPVPEATRASYTAAAVAYLKTRTDIAAATLYVMAARDFAEYGLWTGDPPATATSTWSSYVAAIP